jgi:hypothetical protein
VDPAVDVDPADVLASRSVVEHHLALERSGERRRRWADEAEPLDGHGHPEGLVGPERVVGADAAVQGALGLGDAREHIGIYLQDR